MYKGINTPFIALFADLEIMHILSAITRLFSAGRPSGTRQNSVHCLWFLCCCTQTLHRTPFGTSSYFTHVDVCYCFERDPLRMMELGVDGTFKRRLKLDATPNVPLASPDPEKKKWRNSSCSTPTHSQGSTTYTPVIV
jgi:hypothetical protein